MGRLARSGRHFKRFAVNLRINWHDIRRGARAQKNRGEMGKQEEGRAQQRHAAVGVRVHLSMSDGCCVVSASVA
jgi:hypothetical protein